MTDDPTRREFLIAAAGLAAGLTPPDSLGGVLDSLPGHGRPTSDDLPPRVVGLRSLGGAFRFDPPGLLVQPGDTVRWLNMGDFHTATAFHPDNGRLLPDGVPRRVPEGASPWHSGMLGLTAGTRFQHRFRIEGVHDYFCQPHYGFGMVGRIVVAGPRGGPAVQQGLDELPEAARKEMPTVDQVTGPWGRTSEWAARVNGVLWIRAQDRDATKPTTAMLRGMARDETLQNLLGRTNLKASWREELERFRGGAGGELDYETLLQRADVVKGILREASAETK